MIQSCRYYNLPNSGTPPNIIIDPVTQTCARVGDRDDLRSFGLVGEATCHLIRADGHCPRKLGIEVNLSLIPVNRR